MILVQDPAEAEYDGMPKSAIATGLVDIVAPVAELAAQLVAAKQAGRTLELPADANDLSATAEATLLHLLTHLRVRTGHDFTGYKRATILRRIARRMQVTQLPTLTAYLHRLRQDAEEMEALNRDLLIHVTEFFRDPEAWEVLAQKIVPQLFTGKGRDDQVRVWTVGCATGEEAYGIAMLLLEHAGTLPQPLQIQVFASDLGDQALDYARKGVYPAAIAANVSAERLGRFFIQENSHYQVRDELRERVLFTQHNLLQDPPFSKLDLVLCRNLLIYLQRPLQERVFETFHYALRPEGYLFLGGAESPESITTLFEAVNKQHRIYRPSRESQGTLVLPTLSLSPRPEREASAREMPRGADPGMPGLGEAHAPPSLLVAASYQVLQLSETAGRYLQHPAGTLTSEVLRLVRPELQADLRAALFRALESGHTTLTRPVPVRFNGAPHPVAMFVRPVSSGQALVFFLEDATPVTEEAATDEENSAASAQQMQAELGQAQRQMQALREEYETTVEELRSSNEELQSTNEEYRSTLEELGTSKEELQSVNEELQTVNLELRSKVEETSQSNSDLHNLFAATEIATLFLDRELKIKRYTPRAVNLFNLMPPDQGRPIGHLRTTLHYESLEEDARRVLKHLTPIAREVEDAEGRWYQVNVRPYRTPTDHIDGVVITFVDMTSNKRNELALQEAKEYAESIVHTIPDALLVLDTELRLRTANDSFYSLFQVEPAHTEGRLIYELGNGQWNIPTLRVLLEEILPDNQIFTGYEVDHTFEQLGRRTMLLNGRLDHAQLILLAITDITERKVAEEALRASEEKYRTIFETIDEGFCIYEVIYDGNGKPVDLKWIEVNPAYEKQTGLKNVVGKRHSALSMATEQYWYDIYDRTAKTGEAADFENWHEPTNRWYRVFASRIGGAESKQVAVVFEDITERKQREQQQAFILSFTDATRNLVESKQIQIETCKMLGIELSADRVNYAEIHGNEYVVASEHLVLGLPSMKGRYPIDSFRKEEIDAFRAGKTVIIKDILAEPSITKEEAAVYQAINVCAFISVPLVKAENLVAVLSVIKSEPYQWYQNEIALVEEMAERTWAAVERARAEEALRELNQTLEEQVVQRSQQVRTLVTQLALSEQKERQRISQVLHDDLQQRLYATQFQLTGLRNLLDGQLDSTAEEEAQHLFAELEAQLAASIAQMRTLSVDLSPPVLAGEGLDIALGWLATQMKQQHGLSIQVQTAESLPVLNANLRVLLFQTIRELLFNIVKHAGVAEAVVTLRHTDDELHIEVIDQGTGFDATAILGAPEQNHGLQQNHQRLELLGGQMRIESSGETGTRVVLTCPLSTEDREERT